MTGEDSDSDQDVEVKLRRAPDGDDLGDDFSVGEMDWDGLGSGLAGAYKKGDEGDALESETHGDEDEEDEAEDDEEEEEEEEENADECGDDDFARTDLSEGEGERDDPEDLVATSHLGKEIAKAQTHEELPYTFPCPNSHEDFLQILGGIEDDDVTTVIQRIRALYHPSLGPDNKSKLQVSMRPYH
jgi:nucleolar protein 14